MNMTDTALRYVVLGMVVLILIGVGYSYFSGNKQDEQFIEEQVIYNQAIQLMQQGQYDQALPMLEQVEIEQRQSFPVKYYIGFALANKGDWGGAANAFESALDLNPYKVEDSIFMLLFAEALMYSDKLDEAKVVLQRCQTLPIPEQIPDYQERVHSMLSQISASS